MWWNNSVMEESRLSRNECLDLSQDEATAQSMRYNVSGFVLLMVVMPVLAGIGVLANLAFLVVVYARKSMRTTTNAYLANLALADILFLVSATVPAQIQYFSSPVVFDQLPIRAEGCASVNAVIFLFFYGSVFMVLLVSYERYSAICRPLRLRAAARPARTAKLIAATWATAVLFVGLVIPALSVMETTCVVWPDTAEFADFPPAVGQCRPLSAWISYVSNGLKMAPFFGAMFASGYLYARMVARLGRDLPGLGGGQRRYDRAAGRALRARRQTVVMLVVTGAVFFLCQAPAQVATLAALITDHTEAPAVLSRGQRGILLWVSRVLLFFNSAVNPFVYNLTNSRYRKAFLDTYGCCRSLGKVRRKRFTLPSVSHLKSVYFPKAPTSTHKAAAEEAYSNDIKLEDSSPDSSK